MRSSDRRANDSPQIQISSGAGSDSDPMVGDNWETLKDLFERALDCASPREQSDFLAANCADIALRAELESLLAENRRMNAAFLERDPAQSLRAERSSPEAGALVGAYRLERQLGRGGMGTVFLASRADGAYQKQVAIKLLSATGISSRELVMRFLAERQILARLDHPNIARLVDGGATADGEPYLVMDYVDGVPIDRYCRDRALDLEQRLELFEQVCAAVSYAHENLVVHRDIKPGNILVTPDGTPKLLDFGIAKLLRPDTSDSEYRPTLSILGTPEYSSPEQVRGLAVTKATDVYSLGVLLYELLTGRSPYQLASRAAHEMARVICEEDPQPPSTALSQALGRGEPGAAEDLPAGENRKRRKQLSGDLDNIVMMALRKQPEQRYQSAAELAADLRRHLQGAPVHARGRTPGYRFLKFARRRRAIAVGAIAAVSLLAAVEAVRLSPGWMPNRLHFQNRDWLLMSAFQNRTGEQRLDGALEMALQLELSRSAYVNLAPPQRIADTLKLMQLAADTPLTEDLARQAAIRDGAIKGVLAGRIDKFGGKYLVSVRVVEPVSGATAAAFDRKATQEHLLDAVSTISRDVREALGERLIAAMPQGAPLERATTPSLPALRAFSAGMQAVNAYKWRPAAQLMEDALREDSGFALAHIYAFHCYLNLGADEMAKPHGEAALRLASSVTERERLFIIGSYYQRLAQDYPRAFEAYEALVKLYPDDAWGVTNLLGVYVSLGKTNDVEFGQLLERVVGLRPSTIGSDLYRVWRYYAYRRRDPAKAKRFQEELLRIRTNASTDQASLAARNLEIDLAPMADYWWRGDVQAAAGELSRLTGQVMSGSHSSYVFGLAMMNLETGRNRAAQKLCETLTGPTNRSDCLLRLAFLRGDSKSGQALLNEIQVTGRTEMLMGTDVPLAAWFGRYALAKEWTRAPDPRMLVNALILEDQGAPQAAIDQFTKWNPHLESGATNLQIWYRMEMARALEQQGKLEEAIAQLNQETDPQFVDFYYGWPWPRGRLQLAELYRKAGHSAEAEKIANEIRHYLSEGDSDNPILLRLNSLALH